MPSHFCDDGGIAFGECIRHRDSIPEMRLSGPSRIVNRVSIHFPIRPTVLGIASRKLDVLFYMRKTLAQMEFPKILPAFEQHCAGLHRINFSKLWP